MKTPKEKAKELFEKFLFYTLNDFSDENFEQTRQCALVAVDEILDEDNDFLHTDAHLLYWKQVKQEIKNL
jgi:hypothetical protein